MKMGNEKVFVNEIMLKLRCDWNCSGDCNWEYDCGWLNQLDALVMDWIYGDWMVAYWWIGCV